MRGEGSDPSPLFIMRILSMDPSLRNFGWVHKDYSTSEILERGKFETSPKDMDFVQRNAYLRDEIYHLCTRTDPEGVGVEYPIFNDLYSEGMYALFCFTAEALRAARQRVAFFTPGQGKAHAERYSIASGILPEDWKKVTGEKTMTKGGMVRAAKGHNGGGRWNEHEADAYWIGLATYRFWALYDGVIGLDDLNELELHQFLRNHTYVRGKKKGKTTWGGLFFKENDRFYLWNDTSKNHGTSSKRKSRDEHIRRYRGWLEAQKGGQEEDRQEEDRQEEDRQEDAGQDR